MINYPCPVCLDQHHVGRLPVFGAYVLTINNLKLLFLNQKPIFFFSFQDQLIFTKETYKIMWIIKTSSNNWITLDLTLVLLICINPKIVFSRRTSYYSVLCEPHHEKNQQCGFPPGQTQTNLCSHRRWLEARNFGFRKYRNCSICAAKTKALISFAVTAKLICAFVFANADFRFSNVAAQILFDITTVFDIKHIDVPKV